MGPAIENVFRTTLCSDLFGKPQARKADYKSRMSMFFLLSTVSPFSLSSSQSSSSTCGSLSLLEKATLLCSLRPMPSSGAIFSSIYWMLYFSLACVIPEGRFGSRGYLKAIALAPTLGIWLVALLMLSPTSLFWYSPCPVYGDSKCRSRRN